MTLTAHQNEGLKIAVARYRQGCKYTTIAGYAGSGKAQPNNTKIPTPNGYIEIGSLKVGDLVFNQKGIPTKVLNIFPQGKKPLYKVTFKDGRYSYCADDHLWTYYTQSNKKCTSSTKEILEQGLTNNSGFKYAIPANGAAIYSEQDFPVDPYMLGVFLGDGCCKEKYLTVSSETDEIPNYIGEIIGATPIKNSSNNYNWTFEWSDENNFKQAEWIGGNNSYRTTIRKKPKTEDYFNIFQDYIMVNAYDKDIPDCYKKGSVQQRLALIQGLMDTGGSISACERRYNLRFTTTSLKLINSFQEILWSLGYSSTIMQDTRSSKYTNGVCYSLNINIPNEEKYKFFKLKRKLSLAEEAKQYHKRKNYQKIPIVNIEDCQREVEMTCIYIEDEDHLYLTEQYIPTHNTTLVRFIIDAIGIDEDLVCYCAYTGKAAEVLRKKGNKNVKTLHKLLYEYTPKSTGGFFRKPKQFLGYNLIVVDEISMAPKELIDRLFTHPVHVICLGDPFQLPPVAKNEDNHLLDSPHIFLTEIMRQEAESEIIQLTMKIRNHEPITYFEGKEVKVLPYSDLNTGLLQWGDQILVATNKKRQEINNQMRALEGRSGAPVDGDKIICLRNYWDEASVNQGDALVNGSIGILHNSFVSWREIPPAIRTPIRKFDIISGELLIPDMDDKYSGLEMDYKLFTEGVKCCDWQLEYKLNNYKKKYGEIVPKEFDFAYAITYWKAQGSEWDNVVVLEEKFPFDKEEHTRAMYTAATRASSRLVWVR